MTSKIQENTTTETPEAYQYKGIKYFTTWIEGNWYLVIPDYHKVIEIIDDYTTDLIEELIEVRIVKYL